LIRNKNNVFWFIAFIIVVGLIVEGVSPKQRDKTPRNPTSNSSYRREYRELLENKKARELKKQEEAKALVQARAPKSDKKATQQPPSDEVLKSYSINRPFRREPEVSDQTSSPLAHELEKWGIKSLWHMTHIRNIPSIKRSGLLSHKSPKLKALNPVDISDPEVQRWRTRLDPCFGLALHDYVPFYINPRNPMLYRRKDIQRDICFIEVSLAALEGKDFLVSNGNAASSKTEFYDGIWGLQFLPWEVLRADFWTDFDDGKRKACSEILVPDAVDPKFIKAVHCHSSAGAGLLAQKGINAVISTDKYFR
jgi:hypothetical protein